MATLMPELVWAEVLKSLVQSMPNASFSTWVKPLHIDKINPVGEDRAIIELSADSPYVAQQAELRCYARLKQVIDQVTSRQCDLVFREGSDLGGGSDPAPGLTLAGVRPQPSRPNPETKSTPLSLFSPEVIRMPTVDRYKLAAQKSRLREDFSFDSIAVSSSNEMAYAAGQSVAASPGKAYNPLFIWGGVGVGKTHLMQAIGNHILRDHPDTGILYCMGEEFLNEIIAAIRTKRTLEFKERYRQLKVLLIDDIQFIAGKDTAQEEFFHTFNAIISTGGQIIMTSDRPPHEIHPIEDRLRSRFEGGLTIDIQQPTFELRTAIILIKAQKMGLDLQMQLAQIIAAEVESTRKLEGVVYKIHNAYHFSGKPLDERLVRDILGQESKPVLARRNLKPAAIMRAVTSHFHVSTNTIRGPSRKKEYVIARHIAMFLLKSELGLPYTEIGSIFGGKDHTSVMHAVNKITELMSENSLIQQHVSAIRVSLSAE